MEAEWNRWIADNWGWLLASLAFTIPMLRHALGGGDERPQPAVLRPQVREEPPEGPIRPPLPSERPGRR